ncbi:hypothetical protein GOBAR_AA38917 [Gossypium barbadense]|uniref:Uncharacterized protein n=1 Tax=Gossypium barbadense TaxID=3634 RepID=A0A2P5VSJ3_GOSBA|nr:hypothetical protein GOBAR_AA38917 [Gossypium barbadense]
MEVEGSSRKGSSRKSGRDSAEKKEPVTPSSDRPTRERKVVERVKAWVHRLHHFRPTMEKWCITQDKWINGANGEARVRSAGKKPLLLKLRLWKETKLAQQLELQGHQQVQVQIQLLCAGIGTQYNFLSMLGGNATLYKLLCTSRSGRIDFLTGLILAYKCILWLSAPAFWILWWLN